MWNSLNLKLSFCKLSDTALFLLNKYKTVDRMKRLTYQDCVLLRNKSRRIQLLVF